MFLLSIVISRKCGAADVIVCQRENYTYSSMQRSFNNIWLILIIIANINPVFHRELEDKGSSVLPLLLGVSQGGQVPVRALGKEVSEFLPLPPAALSSLMSYFSFFVEHLF